MNTSQFTSQTHTYLPACLPPSLSPSPSVVYLSFSPMGPQSGLKKDSTVEPREWPLRVEVRKEGGEIGSREKKKSEGSEKIL